MKMLKKNLIVVHPVTFFDPGKQLIDALKRIGVNITLFDQAVDFNLVNQQLYDAVLFIESPYRNPVTVYNIQKLKLPKLYWILHGESRLNLNIQKCREYRINYALLATSLHLAKHYGVPYLEFPMAVEPGFFPNQHPLKSRYYDLSFIGAFKPEKFYQERNNLLNLIQINFPNAALYYNSGIYLKTMGEIYANSKIVFNWNYQNVLTARMFEGMASGALLLTNNAHHIDLLGINRKHFVIYRNPLDLINKIRFYLTNLNKAQAVASLGYQKVINEHTYRNRAFLLLDILRRFT